MRSAGSISLPSVAIGVSIHIYMRGWAVGADRGGGKSGMLAAAVVAGEYSGRAPNAVASCCGDLGPIAPGPLPLI